MEHLNKVRELSSDKMRIYLLVSSTTERVQESDLDCNVRREITQPLHILHIVSTTLHSLRKEPFYNPVMICR